MTTMEVVALFFAPVSGLAAGLFVFWFTGREDRHRPPAQPPAE